MTTPEEIQVRLDSRLLQALERLGSQLNDNATKIADLEHRVKNLEIQLLNR